MSTSTTNTPIDHTTDAGFRAWGQELSNGIKTGGNIIQTSDTGQINWSTVVKPASGGIMAGYEIFRFSDALQATAPVYFKIEYGNMLYSSSDPDVYITVGTGTNGSGTITGVISNRISISSYAPLSSTITNYKSNFCCMPNYVGVEFKRSSSTSYKKPCIGFWISRSHSDDGTPNDNGVHILTNSQSNNMLYYGYLNFKTTYGSPSYSYVTDGSFCFNHWQLTNTLVGINPQVERHYIRDKRKKPSIATASVLKAEATADSTFTTKLFGSTNRTYLVTECEFCDFGNPSRSFLCMLWE